MTVTFVGFSSPDVGITQKLYDVDLIKKDLLNHFNTRKGERVMDAEYGFIGWDLVFELDNAGTISVLETDARRIIESEPRVSEKSISIQKIDYGYILSIELYFIPMDTIDTLIFQFDQNAQDSMNE